MRSAAHQTTHSRLAWGHDRKMGANPEFDQIDALVFDVIGTLVDERATWVRASELIVTEAGVGSSALFHQKWVELLDARMDAVVSGQSEWMPHSRLVAESARGTLASFGGNGSRFPASLVASVDREYPAWPDVAEATATLRRHRLVAGLSNGDLDALAPLANVNRISWDVVLSTGAVETYKPAPAAYEYAIRTLGIDPTRTLFVDSHPWDLRAATQHGFRTAYVGRPGAERPTEDDRFDIEVDGLMQLIERLG